MQVTVKSLRDDEVVIDYNHPMAGKTLMFSVSILAIREASEEEIQTGVIGGMASMGGGCCGGVNQKQMSQFKVVVVVVVINSW